MLLATTHQPDWVRRLDELHLLTPLRIVAIIVAAWLISLVVRRFIGRLIGRVVGLGPRSGVRTEARSRSLAGALRSAVLVAIWMTALIAVIAELGVNLGGVVITATVVGGALAFGAQTLVRDLIAGVFVLSEDQYGVGDVIDVGPLVGGGEVVSGVVERITLRATRVRDDVGRIWHVPNGAITRVANLSLRSVATDELHVARSTPLDRLSAVVVDLASELRAHPQAGPLCTDEPSFDGIAEVRDDRVVARWSVHTQPGRHDDVRRVMREVALEAFQDNRLAEPAGST